MMLKACGNSLEYLRVASRSTTLDNHSIAIRACAGQTGLYQACAHEHRTTLIRFTRTLKLG
eukprot:3407957-Pleurochrysis_carterae.AAC.1